MSNITVKEESKSLYALVQEDNFLNQIAEVLPKTSNNLSAKRFIINTVATLRSNPKFEECKPISVMRAITNAATMGIVPGTRQCYLIPYKDECKMEVGPDGYIDIALRSGEIAKIYAVEVYKDDEFEYDTFNQNITKHVQPIANKTGLEKDIIAFYAVAQYKDGTKRILVKSKAEVDQYKALAMKKNFGKVGTSWTDTYVSMGKTKVIKSLCNELPKTIELSTLLENDVDNELTGKNYIDSKPIEADRSEASKKVSDALHAQLEAKKPKIQKVETSDGEKVVDTTTGQVLDSADIFDGEIVETRKVEE